MWFLKMLQISRTEKISNETGDENLIHPRSPIITILIKFG